MIRKIRLYILLFVVDTDELECSKNESRRFT